ncbi:MAG: hypothetical protein SOR93_14125 [Clostridiales Family XIII bacterium]|uniref:Uncharacterized protein n=1 Tax=Hominibacterium faecale TaxID=2839743 RepID=A0A9J6QYT9_9FIRM|nr:hypothetical protein [Hominibacterium faecale]MCI7303069.1 hypothetical protein [Clostridia bacterium]MCU7380626.1 hypothetical protein [Hominibacterium faecale]MDY3012375.1 hypothetical protein [Clostridiales Family XIII bacterium]
MNTTKNLKLNCLYKINRIAKQCGKMKQEAYSNREHIVCREYKLIQQQLYLLKSLTIMDMQDKQELYEDGLCIDDNGCVLNTYTAEGYIFHEISQCQEISEGTTLTKIHNKPTSEGQYEFWRPYVYYLTSRLSDQYKRLYDAITGNKFELFNWSVIKNCLDLFSEIGLSGEILWRNFCPWDSADMSLYSCTLFFNGIQLCNIKIYVPEDYEITCENGSLEVDTFDEYRDVDFSQY